MNVAAAVIRALHNKRQQDKTRLIDRLASGYVECNYADAERSGGDGRFRKAICKEPLTGKVEVGWYGPDEMLTGSKPMEPAIWLCKQETARDLAAVRNQ
ncbi:hypothetical protein LCGC14_0320380 [marine sediment metagenome]|uniref:Uncharacterized protein n=1 Tax=marine sediment metagenome TaxID=412755 RepID=A0A0F9TJP1_9ZZZZ